MAPALPRTALILLLPLLLASAARSQNEPAASPLPADGVADTKSAAFSPISQPPTAAAADGPSATDSAANSSPPAPPETSPVAAPSDSPAEAPSSLLPPTHTHSAAPAPAPAADNNNNNKASSPAPAPAAQEIKASSAAASQQAAGADEGEVHEEMNGGKKAGVVVGAFTAAAVVGLGCFVWRKRRANIRRARYADYAARLELV
ncbi:skin secretory protein xP2-like [Panicum virgatum]|uniref:Uncharacterized protein n=1 Tax=Panicum virgatum TaxID=38727 RepID=A0A8T0N803_PANVG|nr:skin secretory protein xP2-like [Panicum virgatum]KAG2544442.1 hypothetical protein PVAP13_9KG019000 [Panicum virgatum]